MNFLNNKRKCTPLLFTIIGCGLMLFLAGEKYHGFMVVFFGLYFSLSALQKAYFIFKYPEKRKLCIGQIFTWIVSFFILGVIHYNYQTTSRTMANKLISKIIQYKSEHQEYPKGMDTIGLSKSSTDGYKMFYVNDEDGPSFFYLATFMFKDTYHYNFDNNEWEYFAD